MSTDDRKETPSTTEATDQPATDPTGTVRVHPDDDPADPAARRFIRTIDGGWSSLTHPPGSAPAAVPSDAVRGWPRQPLADLALRLGHPDGRIRSRGRAAEARAGSAAVARVQHQPHHRPTRTPPSTPSFWEAAKVYCRALRTMSDLMDYWYEQYQAATASRPGPHRGQAEDESLHHVTHRTARRST
ncbi:hypothetical protein GCM10011581_21220 [Saccharopolyspora subtropica]|uniref:Uncharacterized protein n=1 Tax=Saccharopolyspora thermophila TaxID=89367 RepID=A0A917JSB2_9PSEU|nr:hypothetical protein [Saccharopolyspora subtropica]GGI83762.1 hypothetical protein GCM10011581_21220 [Saccharopolyspora subtropica]